MLLIASFSSAQEQAAPSVPQPKVFDPKSPPIHDPVMAKDGDTYMFLEPVQVLAHFFQNI